jgi:hypothetical protein
MGMRAMALAGCAAMAALAPGCATKPSFTRTVTTLGEVDMTGMVCRRSAPAGSHIPQTVCASQATWDRQDAAEAAASARLRDDGNRQTNVDQFGRGRN